jgi:predicted AAA+ superfamily ATPase
MTLTPAGYRRRLIDDHVDRMLRTFGAISIEGPKWCGKTWTAEHHSNSEIKVAGSTGPVKNSDLIRADIRNALSGDVPHLIDEWREVPQIRDSVRDAVDGSPEKGRFILTGSSVPKRETYVHSGAGRIGTVRMRTMTLFETGDSEGKVSLREILNGKVGMTECKNVTLDCLAGLMVRGGWPGAINIGREEFGLVPSDYVNLAADDASRLDGRTRQSNKMRMLLRSLARNESTLASDATVMKDMKRFDDENIAIETYYEYMDCLDRTYLIDEIPCFRPNVRSDMRIGKTPKRHLADVSLAIAALGLNRETIMNDPETFGFMFEALCEHDLRIYSESLGAKLFHYRDGRGREIDAVIEMPDGGWGAFEIKLGAGQTDDAAEKLLSLSGLFERESNKPSVLCVVCGTTNYAYQRQDGVFVVPITALGP